MPLRLRNLFDLVGLAWIGWFAWQHAGFLLRNDLYLYGDHPGQFYRLWQLLTVVWPEQGQLIGWSPYWYAGWPEIQFYPPGFVLLGWLIWMGSFQQLPPVAIHQSLAFASFILPGLGLYLLLAWGFGDRLAGLVAAWLAMTAPLPLGGVLGVFIGLVGDRLAFGLVPLLILSGLWLLRSPGSERKTWPWLVTGLILACLLLMHPFQAILPLGVLGLCALWGGQDRLIRLRWLAWVTLLGLGLTAFWWLPLVLRLDFYIPLIEAPLLEIQTNLEALPWFDGVGWLLVAAVLGSLFRPSERRWLALSILLMSLGLLSFTFVDYHLLVEGLKIYAIDPVRLISGISFALLVGLALGVSELAWLGVRLLQRWGWGVVGLPLVLIVPWLIYQQVTEDFDFSKWMQKWQPESKGTPLFLREAETRYNLPAVWKAMAVTPGRILFTSYYTLFFDVPTSLKAATPILTGREIIGGTFTTRTPVAAYIWTGQANLPVMRGKIEHQDDKTLAGVAWANMSDEFLFDLARHLNVTLIATTLLDANARAFLDASSHFKLVWSNGLFFFYGVNGYEPTWAEAEQATAVVTRYDHTAVDVNISNAAPGATLAVKVAHYPLWQAEAEGQPLPIQSDERGLMRLALPPGSYTIHLRYQPGWPERIGMVVSLATAVVAVGLIVRRMLF
jgi:hypothetical protein